MVFVKNLNFFYSWLLANKGREKKVFDNVLDRNLAFLDYINNGW